MKSATCQLLTGEVNAAIEGAFDVGATHVVVADSHSQMTNILPDLLHPEAELIRGVPRPHMMMQGLDAGFNAALVDGGLMVAALAGLSLPSFWLAIILIIIFGITLKWVPVTGGTGIQGLILPAICLAVAPAAAIARLTRSSIKEVVHEDYVRTALAKGLGQRRVVLIHMVRNALIPVVTVIGLEFAALMGGAVFIESVFARPGLGRFAVNAIAARDYPQIQGIILFAAVVYVLVNLGIDILYAVIDPRIRYS